MKYKLITVIVLLVLMLAGGIWECVYITKTFRELEQRTNEILSEDAIDKQKVLDTAEWLDKQHKRLEFVVPHFQLNEVSFTCGELVAPCAAMTRKRPIRCSINLGSGKRMGISTASDNKHNLITIYRS